MKQAFLIRRARVSACFAEVIQWIQSLRALGVMSDHNARAFGRGRESFSQICRHRGFRLLCRGRDLEGDNVARVCARSFAQLPVHFEPVAFLAVGIENRLKREAIDSAFDRCHAAGRELRTSVHWQNKKGPGVGLLALRRPEEFRFETDFRTGFGHFAWYH